MPRSKIPPEQRLKACILCGEIFNYTGTNSKTCGKHRKHKTCRCATCNTNYIYFYGSKESNYRYCSAICKKNKVRKQGYYGERSCVACGALFNAQSHNQKLCPAHIKKKPWKCVTCGVSFWGPSTGAKRAGRYCSTACHPKKVEKKTKVAKLKALPQAKVKPKPPELKPAIPLANGRPKGPTIEKVKDYCAVCKVVIPNENKISKYCTEHRYYAKVQCRFCKADFHTPRSDKKLYCHETCRLNDQKPCQVCGVYFQPLTKGQIYCDTHNKGGPDANKYSIHWKMGAPAFVGNPKDNPYKAGVLKPCEATEKHPDCSGTMMVFANEWTRCIHCAKMLTRQSASISHVRDF